MEIQQVKDDAVKMAILFAALFGILEIAFYKGSILVNLRIAIGLFVLFVIPGYFLMNYWRKNFGFTEYAIGSSLMASALYIVFTYYLGLLKVNVLYTTISFPILVILGYLGFEKWKMSKK